LDDLVLHRKSGVSGPKRSLGPLVLTPQALLESAS
jgi:hypothetical protein